MPEQVGKSNRDFLKNKPGLPHSFLTCLSQAESCGFTSMLEGDRYFSKNTCYARTRDILSSLEWIF